VLRDFPEIGAVVEVFQIESIREIHFHGYRIIYEYDGIGVAILMVIHGSADLKLRHLHGD
jgi:plasmid stabilization system protein ParE